ncbi:MAG: ABC transporter ATP-binding protein [Eubacteriales bacterium]|nr:ABC transporter ATP-binding protein [Eubacteriales bacterium]
MKIKPVVLDRLQTRHTSFEVDLQISTNITLIQGDSGVGKSALFSFLQELAVEDKRIRCFNYLDINTGYKNSIRRSHGKLFIIDNADILLDDAMREYVAMDGKNQYIIIGRNPTGLLLTRDNIFELAAEKIGEKTRFTLKESF